MTLPDLRDGGGDDVEVLAEAFLVDYRAGMRPCAEDFVERFPQLAGEIQDLLKAILILEENSQLPEDSGLEVEAPATGSRPAKIADFKIIREIGRGGMGIVYEAVQESLNRTVAL
jgi:eukaryotic-like serine/threonine-protein kinase